MTRAFRFLRGLNSVTDLSALIAFHPTKRNAVVMVPVPPNAGSVSNHDTIISFFNGIE